MKIMLHGVNSPDSFVDNLGLACAELGHEAVFSSEFGEARRWGRLYRAVDLGREFLRGARPTPADTRLLHACRREQPDLVLAATVSVHPEVMAELGHIVPKGRVAWWADAPANMRRWGVLDAWDHVFLSDVDAVRRVSIARGGVWLLHEAMNPSWHRPVSGPEHGRVVLAGNMYAYRQAIILRLLASGVEFELHGPTPPHWGSPMIKERHSGRYVVREEKSRVFGQGLAVLNNLSLAEGNSLNCRAFEVTGAGGLLIMEHRPCISECFEPGQELLVYKTYEELLACLEVAQADPDRAARIRLAGARRARACHTYSHRLQEILTTIGA